MSWPKYRLEELVRISKGKKHTLSEKQTSTRYIQIDDLRNDNLIKYTIDEVGVFVESSDVIIAWDGANAGTIGYGLAGLIGSTLARLSIINSEVDTEYLARFLQRRFREIRDNCTGATIPHVSRPHLISLEIPLPPLHEQKRIAAILDKADAIRRKRQQAIQLADDFLRSVFLDMFGDPVTNPKGWKTTPLKAVAPGISTKNVSINNDDNVWLLNLDAVEAQTGKILKELSLPLSEVGSSTNHFDSSHVLYSKLRPYLNKVVIPNKSGMATSELITLKPDLQRLTREFLVSYLRSDSFVNWANMKVAGAKMPRLSTAELWKHEIYLPPLDLQLEFVAAFSQVNELNKKNEISKRDSENGFNSLSQKAFAGEL